MDSKFITFEGGEGCGKSTQSKLLYDYLLSKDYQVVLTREIGGTPEAEKIRDLVLHSELLSMSELLLIMAARYEHMQNIIIPALSSGKWVICDRFIDSTACYQGISSEIGRDKIYQLHQELISIIMPDVTFFIDVPVGIAMRRILNRIDNNKFEEKPLSFHQTIHDGFCKISELFPKRVIRIEAKHFNRSDIHSKILEHI